MGKQYVGVNEAGLRVGEDHPRAKLSDHDVDLILELHLTGMGYAEIANKFEVTKWAIGRICRYERRAQTVTRMKLKED